MRTSFLSSIAALCCAFIFSACGGGSDISSTSGTSAMKAPLAAPTVTQTFSGNRNNYTIASSSTGYSVQDNSTGGSVAVNTSSVQALKFSDVTVNLGIGSKSKTLSTAELNTLIELYVAFFNRVPDADGLSYWIDEFKNGRSIDSISLDFYNAAVQYTSLTGYSTTMSDADFVRVIYKNVLGRTGATAPPEEDVQYWAGRIASGAESKGSLIRTMLASAHSFTGDATWGWVPQLLDNKVTVATYFAIQHGLNYNTAEASISNTMAIAAAVTSSSTSAATSMINISDTGFNLQNQATVQSFAGVYSGTYSGADAGSFTVTISSVGNITGTAQSSVDGWSYSVSGSVTSSGSLSMSTLGSAGSAAFTGTIDVATGTLSGTWYSGGLEGGGSFSGNK